MKPKRQPQGTRKERIHILIEASRLPIVERAAKKLGLARSNFIAGAAHDVAVATLAKSAAK